MIDLSKNDVSRAPRRRAWSSFAVGALLLIQASLLLTSIPRNSVTVDEVMHLPAGMSYWHLGAFWCYHHNPPLMKLAFSLPAVIANVPVDYTGFHYKAGSRFEDLRLGLRFMRLNAVHYMKIYVIARCVVATFALAGGLLVYRWSSELFGRVGGAISLSLWVFCPEILAHGGLVTMDLGATVMFLFAGYGFREYLNKPTLFVALACGVLLGLAEATKFSLAVIPGIWLILLALAMMFRTDRFRGAAGRISVGRLALHAAVVSITSLVVLSAFYNFEGIGGRLGEFAFRSKLLSGSVEPVSVFRTGNRFRGGMLERVPIPLPAQYVLGFDDQMFDIDSTGYHKYLRGELRQSNGWWYYYLYYYAVKTPAGTLFLIVLALFAAIAGGRACRVEPIEVAAILLPAVVLLVAVSSQTGMNFGRYALPIAPFLFIFAGRLGRLVERSKRWRIFVSAALFFSAVSTVAVHPNYLTYFNEFVGGPDHGKEHLADSSLDWGQGLVELKTWLDSNAPGRPIHLAYFGMMDPSILGISYEFAPFGRVADSDRYQNLVGPIPGLHAISANFLVGVPFTAPYATSSTVWAPAGAYTYFNRFKPKAIVAHSIYIFDLTEEDAESARRELGLPPLDPPQSKPKPKRD